MESLFSVVGKNVLVTGGSRGIGYMIAKGYVNAGANVILTSRDETACSNAVKSIENSISNSSCRYVTSSLSTRQGCETLASKVQSMFSNGRKRQGCLDILINNAGTSWGEDPWNNFEYDDNNEVISSTSKRANFGFDREYDDDKVISSTSKRANFGFDRVFDLNVKSLFYLTRACVPLMISSEKEELNGRVVNIGSIAGILPQDVPTHAYDVSKAAVHHLTKKLAADLAPQRITVNAIAPGYVPSRMSKGLLAYNNANLEGKSEEDKMNVIARNIPLRRLGNEDDMIGACLYLTRRAGSWCTGVILNVDGGQAG
eukprot:CAMPEP_0194195416 /NCGR_PEP_ID=MMETSP0154-20130528/76124_1 /TAXON_ID=1049557 /ORGANISM="Thalassiothrix antarctica, Strain L6-D1" /LENGTH=313 /DNA_ID=CAMNT_0038919947 /DNA_START=54 /DNA_END=991 /DNA_ORIENTATION=-